MDVLTLIPTHLDKQGDRFRASFVCRHWRRTFIQRGELWTQLFLSKGEAYAKTLLGRAKGSTLDITVGFPDPTTTLELLSSRSKQIRSLTLSSSHVKVFSQAVPGPYPLVHTLTIDVKNGPYYSNSSWLSIPSPLVFPNLVSFDLQAGSPEDFSVLQLLDFLESSPILETVRMKIAGYSCLEGIHQGRVVILPNIKHLDLTMDNRLTMYNCGPSSRIAAHISCPSARFTSMKEEIYYDSTIEEDILPHLVHWSAIIHQYTRSLIEEVAFELEAREDVKCRLAFRSLDGAVIELCYNVTIGDEDSDTVEEGWLHRMVYERLLTEATGTIQNYPQLANIKRLRILHYSFPIYSSEMEHTEKEAARLFETMGPLEELAIHCDPRPYLHSFLTPRSSQTGGKIVFPQIKGLTILYCGSYWRNEVKSLAKSRHAQGIPFECLTFLDGMPPGIEKDLRSWVGSVKYCRSRLEGWDF